MLLHIGPTRATVSRNLSGETPSFMPRSWRAGTTGGVSYRRASLHFGPCGLDLWVSRGLAGPDFRLAVNQPSCSPVMGVDREPVVPINQEDHW